MIDTCHAMFYFLTTSLKILFGTKIYVKSDSNMHDFLWLFWIKYVSLKVILYKWFNAFSNKKEVIRQKKYSTSWNVLMDEISTYQLISKKFEIF